MTTLVPRVVRSQDPDGTWYALCLDCEWETESVYKPAVDVAVKEHRESGCPDTSPNVHPAVRRPHPSEIGRDL